MSIDFRSEILDHLGLVAGMFDELGIGETLDRVIPQDLSQKKVSAGQSIKAMVLNGLGFANKQLYLVSSFFDNKPTERLIGDGIKSEHLNDDTLGRTLDAVFEAGPTEVFSILSHNAVIRLGLEPPKFGHVDITSFHTDGRYNSEQEPEEGVIQITKGYSRDHRPNHNQVALELIVENQACLPILMRPLSGNTSDKTEFGQVIKSYVKQIQHLKDIPYLVMDSAFYTKDNIKEMKDDKWISRVPETLKEAKTAIEKTKHEKLIKIDDNYSYLSFSSNYAGISQRWLLIESKHARKRAIHTVDKKILRESTREEKAFIKLCGQRFACIPDAEKALLKFQSHLKYLLLEEIEIVSILHYGKTGRPKQNQTPDSIDYKISGSPFVSLDCRNQLITNKSRFILATNELDTSKLTHIELLKTYKDQVKVEKGFRFLKDPLFMASSIFLKSPKRIMALMMVMTVCLLVYAALEHRIRQGLKENDFSVSDQKGKPTQRPTARWVFQIFSGIHLLITHDLQCIILNLNEQHQLVLKLLGKRYEAIWDVS